ncbi:hypothetical protein [Calothrix sp. UHCC 0171]|uniref:hypothetical protein n=1 Tax=Calothrix sp. UHCC 0171 TaxID=3110245 RepID=UPI002B1EE91D|nr:hypothetical protein [Calothrix sp. UHCC 0171]MEA5569950.1 hypothetical protein [Calothrix sp. UHCC 0171]
MAAKFKKSLMKMVMSALLHSLQIVIVIFVVTLLTIILVTPGVAIAFPTRINLNQFPIHQTAIIAFSHPSHIFIEEKLTPQERQELQAVRQGRNREIVQVLTKSQRRQLEHFLRSGNSLEKSIEALDLERDQWDTIQAVLELSELKIKGILYRHSLPMEPA